MIRSLKILISLLLILLVASSIFLYQFFVKPLNISQDGYYYELRTGQALSHFSANLQEDGTIINSRIVNLYGRFTGLDKRLHVGEYYLPYGSSLLELLRQVGTGATLQRNITFVEGWNVYQLLDALYTEPALNTDTLVRDLDTLVDILGIKQEHPEGMFFADTYFFSKGTSALTLLRFANQRLEKVLQTEWENRSADLPLKTPYEALILASIVERETGLASERPLIAGVFVNRLNKGMRLQTDPTVIYGLGKDYQGRITRKHLETYTPYNTYRITGLPPTPIAMVGRESIHAALHPMRTQHLYFVAKGDGSHYFSPSYQEHREAVRKFQLNRVEGYRSTPMPIN